MAIFDDGDIFGGSQSGNYLSGPLESIKSILLGENGNRQEDIKTLAIFIAFQVLVPSAIKLISYAANSADVYFGHSQNDVLGDNTLSPETIIDSGAGSTVGLITNDPSLVDGIQQNINASE